MNEHEWRLAELYAHAYELERAMRYAEASDAFLVLADGEEESGDMAAARSLRTRALRNYVTAWARKRWPRGSIHLEHVDIAQSSPRARRSRIDLTIRRRQRTANYWERVSVGRRGDVRLEESDTGDEERLGQSWREWVGYERQPWQRGGQG